MTNFFLYKLNSNEYNFYNIQCVNYRHMSISIFFERNVLKCKIEINYFEHNIKIYLKIKNLRLKLCRLNAF